MTRPEQTHLSQTLGVHLGTDAVADAQNFEAHRDDYGHRWVTYHAAAATTPAVAWHADDFDRIIVWADALRACAIRAALAEPIPFEVDEVPRVGDFVRVTDEDQVRADSTLDQLQPTPDGRWLALVEDAWWTVERFVRQPAPSVTWDAVL
jgi:hypothetical protein